MVERRRGLHDAVTEPDALRALRSRGEEHLGRRGVAVLLEEVVLDLPHVVDAERIRELDLLERVLDQLVLGTFVPGTGKLVLVEDPELHCPTSSPAASGRSVPDAWKPSRISSRRRLPISACSTSANVWRNNAGRRTVRDSLIAVSHIVLITSAPECLRPDSPIS